MVKIEFYGSLPDFVVTILLISSDSIIQDAVINVSVITAHNRILFCKLALSLQASSHLC